jgi:hypothetical protein
MAAHLMYRNGCEKNRGIADIVTRSVSRTWQDVEDAPVLN